MRDGPIQGAAPEPIGLFGIEKTWPGQTAPMLGPVDLPLEPGSRIALLGPSGCGKTTLLRILAGLDTEFVGARRMGDLRIALMFQEPRLLPWYSVEKNVALACPGAPPETAAQALAAVGLEAARDGKPATLSLGMARRVGLARALVTEPDVLLLDEPLASLDGDTAAEMVALLRRVLKEAPARRVVFVSHNADDARALCTRLVHLGGMPCRVQSVDPHPGPSLSPSTR